jgi:hypothetical protein
VTIHLGLHTDGGEEPDLVVKVDQRVGVPAEATNGLRPQGGGVCLGEAGIVPVEGRVDGA